MKRKWVRLTLPILAISALALGCGDDNGGTTGVTINDLAGTWNATSMVLSVPGVSLDLVQTFGADVTLNITTGERYTLTVEVPGTPTMTVTGNFTISGSNFTLTDDDEPTEPISGTFSLSGNTLTVNASEVELVDFDQDGVEDPADMAAVFQRAS